MAIAGSARLSSGATLSDLHDVWVVDEHLVADDDLVDVGYGIPPVERVRSGSHLIRSRVRSALAREHLEMTR